MADSADSTRAPDNIASDYQRQCDVLKSALIELSNVEAAGTQPLWGLANSHAVDRESLQQAQAILTVLAFAIAHDGITASKILVPALDGARSLLALEAAAARAHGGAG